MTIELKTRFITGDKKPYIEIPCQCGEINIKLWKGAGKYKCSSCKKVIVIKTVKTRFKTGRSY